MDSEENQTASVPKIYTVLIDNIMKNNGMKYCCWVACAHMIFLLLYSCMFLRARACVIAPVFCVLRPCFVYCARVLCVACVRACGACVCLCLRMFASEFVRVFFTIVFLLVFL